MAQDNIISRLLNNFGYTRQDVLVENADSKGVILDYLGVTTGKKGRTDKLYGRDPSFDPKKVLTIVRNDPVVRAAVITLVDKVVESGWRVHGFDKKSRKKDLESKLRELRFDSLLRKVVYNLVMYNNAFVEIRKKGKTVTNLNILETEYMRIVAEDNGDVLYYYQEASTEQTKQPQWTPDEIVHFKLDDFTTNVWSEFNIEAIYETVLIKDYIRQWLHWFYKTNQLRPIISVENATGEKMKEFVAYLKAAEQHVGKPIPVEGKVTIDKLQAFADEGKTVMDLIRWCDEQIRMLLQVPPLAVGQTDESGRSDGAEQRLYLNTRVLNIQRILEDDVTYDLFPQMGFPKVGLSFGVLDETTRTRVFETVQLMRNSQFSEEAILEYLESQGAVFSTDEVFVNMEEIMQMSNKDLGTGNEGMKGNVSTDAAQSRQRQNDDDLSDANTQAQQK